MTKSIFLSTLIFGFVLLNACTSSQQTNKTETDSTGTEAAMNDSVSIVDGSIPIFYNMYLSVEMSSLFKGLNASYNKKLLNSFDKANEYDVSGEKAVNLGVYAVDLSYARVFDQIEDAGNYLKAMNKLSTELGIPGDKFYLSVKRIEQNVSNKDSLVKIANELYSATESYLKDSDREGAAALVVLGGWTEAMYIATNMVNKKHQDIELLERIADQKTSLQNLIDLLKKYKNDKNIDPYFEHLNKLTAAFNSFEVNEKNLESTYKQLAEVSSAVQLLRKEIVD